MKHKTKATVKDFEGRRSIEKEAIIFKSKIFSKFQNKKEADDLITKNAQKNCTGNYFEFKLTKH